MVVRGLPIERRFLGLFQGDAAAGVAVVAKRRLQRCLWIDHTSGPVEVSRDQPRPRGIDIELVQIRMAGPQAASYWSLAFEAFPGDQQMAEPFEQTVAEFLKHCPALPLSADRSMSYPRWLLEVARPRRWLTEGRAIGIPARDPTPGASTELRLRDSVQVSSGGTSSMRRSDQLR